MPRGIYDHKNKGIGIYIRTKENFKQCFRKGQLNILNDPIIKKKMVEAKTGMKYEPFTEEHKRNIGKANKGNKFSEESRKNMSEAHKGKKREPHTEETKKKMSIASKGKPKSEEHKRSMSEVNKGKPSFFKGKHHTEETKRILREIRFDYIKKTFGIIFPTIGINEKQILDELEKELGYRIVRQFQCCGYHLDGYIPEMNLAIEVDEKKHIAKIEKDLRREEIIKQKLGCQFLRIKDYI